MRSNLRTATEKDLHPMIVFTLAMKSGNNNFAECGRTLECQFTFAGTFRAKPGVVLAYYVGALLSCQPHTTAVKPFLALVAADHESATT